MFAANKLTRPVERPLNNLREVSGMTAVELLRQRAAKMQHAVVQDRVIDADGRVEAEREFHYLTCRRCDLERQAQFILSHCPTLTPFESGTVPLSRA